MSTVVITVQSGLRVRPGSCASTMMCDDSAPSRTLHFLRTSQRVASRTAFPLTTVTPRIRRNGKDIAEYDYDELDRATGGFDSQPAAVNRGGCKIGAGRLGEVFASKLVDASGAIQQIAIKRLNQVLIN